MLITFIFIVFRNQVVHLWNHWGLRMQSWWDKVVDRFGDDSFYFYAYGIQLILFGNTQVNNLSCFQFENIVMNAWNIALFWTVGSLYLIIELLSWPKWLMRYKVQPNVSVDRKRILSVLSVQPDYCPTFTYITRHS